MRAIKKIFITTLTMFIILVMYTVPHVSLNEDHVLRTNLEIEDISNIDTDYLYLINDKGYLVRAEIFISSVDINDKISKMIEYLTINSLNIPVLLNGYIPIDVSLLGFSLEDRHLTLDFSRELLNYIDKDKILTGVVYSFLELDKVDDVSIMIEHSIYSGYQNLTKEMGINQEYLFTSLKDIQKVILYYMDDTNTYYVPVTRYLNDKREKVEIIIEQLKDNHIDLISLENIHTELLDYRNEENVFFLNFNESFRDYDSSSMDKLIHTIAYSIFDNYDVNMVVFEVEHKNIEYISRE